MTSYLGARAAGRFTVCTDFILTACVCNMTWGGDQASYNLDMGGETGATGRMVRICEQDDSVLSTDQHTRKADLFIFYNSSPGPGMCTWRELETGS